MALSTYFNLDFQQTPSTFLEATPTLNSPQHHLFAYPDENFFFPNSTFVDASFLYPADDIYYPPLFQCNSSAYDPTNCNISLSDNDIVFPFQTQDDYQNLLPCPKRQKCFFNDNYGLVPTNLFDSLHAEEPPLSEAELFYAMAPEFQIQQLPQCGNFVANDDENKKGKENEKIISAQSLAARERRRKISDKTQELGKIVPGGTKMNTAQMLNAAGKYIQYLQAQVQMLQLMNTLQEEEEVALAPSIDEDLPALFVSPLIQEKMYLEEKCFVPKDFVTTLTNLDNLQSSPSILQDLNQLIGIDHNKKKAKQE